MSIPNFTSGEFEIVSTGNIAGTSSGDILWQNVANQSLLLWEQDGTTTVSVAELPSLSGFNVVITGDFDGDGFEDPLMRSGNLQRILLSSTGDIETTGGASHQPVATLDLSSDGKDDLLLLQNTNATYFVRLMDGASFAGIPGLATGFAADDQFHDAFDGVDETTFSTLWFDTSANVFQLSNYDSGVRTDIDTFTVATGRIFQQGGDFDGDGNRDFLFRDETGFGINDIEIVFTDENGFEVNRLEYDADLFDGLTFFGAGDFDSDGLEEALAYVPVSGEILAYNPIGSDQFAREIFGGTGDDLIDAREGNDSVFGGDGSDILLGGEGRDWLFTGTGDDRADGGLGDDSLVGYLGDDTLVGGAGNDMISGGQGDDTLEAGNGTDFLIGDDGEDYLVGGAFGFDHLRGGGGNDLIRGGSDRGVAEGGEGDDVIIGSSSNDVQFGGSGDDFIVGGLSQDTIFGGTGDDIIFGVDVAGTSGTDDTLYGGSGKDFFYLGNDDGNFYTGSGEAYIKDYSTSVTSGDHVMLNGTAANYIFFDAGATIQIQQSSDSNIIAVIDTTASASAVAATAIYIG